jgi:predicted transglutaminase-like cysteine proteinase
MKVQIKILIVFLFLISSLLGENKTASVFDFSTKELKDLEKNQTLENRILNYENLKKEIKELNFIGKIAQVNSFFNTFEKAEDIENYGVKDYWAIPKEFFQKGGDCEDFVIAKYFSFIEEIKIEKEKLFFLIAKRGSSFHMVLLYADSLENSPLVFDNETNNIIKLEKRADLTPIVAFNEYQSLVVINGKIEKEKIIINWGEKNHFKELLIKIKGEEEK